MYIYTYTYYIYIYMYIYMFIYMYIDLIRKNENFVYIKGRTHSLRVLSTNLDQV